MPHASRVFAELRRRKVIPTALVYIALAWAAIELHIKAHEWSRRFLGLADASSDAHSSVGDTLNFAEAA